MMTKLCILLAALAVACGLRVPLLPGWTVPLPVLLLAVEITACTAGIALIVLRARREARPAWPSGGRS